MDMPHPYHFNEHARIQPAAKGEREFGKSINKRGIIDGKLALQKKSVHGFWLSARWCGKIVWQDSAAITPISTS
jgi:hypothetical protein